MCSQSRPSDRYVIHLLNVKPFVWMILNINPGHSTYMEIPSKFSVIIMPELLKISIMT